MTTHLLSLSRPLVLAFCFALSAPAAIAAPINYGDFSGTSVMYLDVTESTNSADDSEPQFGAPTIGADVLAFSPSVFAASARSGSVDLTDGQLNIMIMGLAGAPVSSLTVSENGVYTLQGSGSSASQVVYGLGIGSLTVFEVDGIALPTPIALPGASASGGDNLSAGADIATPWNLGLFYDVSAALQQAGVAFSSGATKLEIVIASQLGAISEFTTNASINNSAFTIDTKTTSTIPLPGGFVLMLSGLVAAGLRKRTRCVSLNV